jgi:hypothetical protein
MDDLVEWLRVQLDLDQAWAQSLPEQPGSEIYNGEQWVPAPARDRMLREVEATRRILDMCAGWIAEPLVKDWEIDRADELRLQNDVGPTLLRLIALPYSDRPGYQEEWRP